MNDIHSLIQALETGSITSETLAEQSLDKISAHQQDNAFVTILKDRALQKAQEADQRRQAGKSLGPLDGIPLAVKDNIVLEGVRSTCGSKILENFVSPYTSTAAQKLESQGAVIVGTTNMDEFAMGASNETSYHGPVRNPQAPDRIPGGSSGGSASAVASGCIPAALGSDTGGSIRQPAACCGVVGFKPTYGRVSRYGLVAYASSLDQIGPITNTVADAGLLLNTIAGQDAHDNTTSPHPVVDYTSKIHTGVQGLTIGIPQEYFAEGMDPRNKEALLAAIARLESEGATLKEISLPSIQYAISSYYIIATAEASSNLSRFDGVRYSHRSAEAHNLNDLFTKSRSEGFGMEVKRRILLGTYVLSSGFYDAYYVKAQKVRRLITEDFQKAFTQCDVIASPTMPGLPNKNGEMMADPLGLYLSDIYTVSLNMAGLPGITVPCGRVDGLKVSLQLIGKHFDEATLLQTAAAVESTAQL